MAVAFDDDKEQDENEDQPLSPMQGLAPVSNKAGGTGSGSAPIKNPNQTPSRFVEFQKYFDANAGGANRMADKLANDTRTQADSALAGLKQAQDTFSNNVQQGRGQPRYQDIGGFNYQTYDGEYNGPSEFGDGQDLSGVRSGLNDAYSNLQALGSTGGIQARLGNTGASGKDRFNAQLANRAGQSRFNNLINEYRDLPNAMTNAATQAQDTISDAEQEISGWNAQTRASAARDAIDDRDEFNRVSAIGNEELIDSGNKRRNPRDRDEFDEYVP